jgi:hypothetical protein
VETRTWIVVCLWSVYRPYVYTYVCTCYCEALRDNANPRSKSLCTVPETVLLSHCTGRSLGMAAGRPRWVVETPSLDLCNCVRHCSVSARNALRQYTPDLEKRLRKLLSPDSCVMACNPFVCPVSELKHQTQNSGLLRYKTG